MIRTAEVQAFLVSRGVSGPFGVEEEVPAMPDQIVMLRITGGAGTVRERIFDRVIVQVRARGNQDDRASAEALADQVDHAFMDALPPIRIAARPVTRIDYAGSQPAFLGRDEGRRSTYACSYVIEVERN